MMIRLEELSGTDLKILVELEVPEEALEAQVVVLVVELEAQDLQSAVSTEARVLE